MSDSLFHHGVLSDGRPCVLRSDGQKYWIEIPDPNPKGFEAFRDLQEREVDARITLRLDNGKIATLLRNYYRDRSLKTAGGGHFSMLTIGSNQVIIGHGEFNEAEKLHQFSFSITNEDLAFFYLKHRGYSRLRIGTSFEVDSLFDLGLGSGDVLVDAYRMDKTEPCNVVIDHLDIKFDINISQHFGRRTRSFDEVKTIIFTYNELASLSDTLSDMHTMLSYFSLIIGSAVGVRKVQFLEEPVVAGDLPEPFELALQSRKEDGGKLETLEPILSLERHEVTYAEALRVWFSRAKEWKSAYHYVVDNSSRGRSFGKDRFLSALGWFEAIPPFYVASRHFDSDEILEKATDAALNELRVSPNLNEDRVRGLMAQLKHPSLAARLKDAVAWIASRYGAQVLPADKARFIRDVPKMRALYAHGGTPEKEYGWPAIIRAVLGMEFICTLLTLSELPVSIGDITQAYGHPVQHAWRSALGD